MTYGIFRATAVCCCFFLSHKLWRCVAKLSRVVSRTHRPEDDERASEEQVLHHAQALHGRHAAHLHQLPRVQPAGERILQVRQPTGEVLLHQNQGGGTYRKVARRRRRRVFTPSWKMLRLISFFFFFLKVFFKRLRMRLPAGGSGEGGARQGLLTDLTVTLTGKEEDEEEAEDHSRSSDILTFFSNDETLPSLSFRLSPTLPTPPQQCSPECDVALPVPAQRSSRAPALLCDEFVLPKEEHRLDLYWFESTYTHTVCLKCLKCVSYIILFQNLSSIFFPVSHTGRSTIQTFYFYFSR